MPRSSWRLVQVLCDDRQGISACKRRLTREQFIEHTTERVEITLRHGLSLQRLLGCHVQSRAHDQSGLSEPAAAFRTGEAEVHDLRRAIGRDDDVLRLEVAMHDAAFVCKLDCLEDLAHDGQRVPPGHRDEVMECVALHKLHHDVAVVAVLNDIVRRDNTGVGQFRG